MSSLDEHDDGHELHCPGCGTGMSPAELYEAQYDPTNPVSRCPACGEDFSDDDWV